MAAHFSRNQKLDAVKAARALLSASPAELAAGIQVLRDGVFMLPDDGTALRPAVFALVGDLRAHIAKMPIPDGAEAARELLWLEHSLDGRDEAAHNRRMAEFLATYKGTPASFRHIIGQVSAEYGYDASKSRPRFLELAREHDGTEAGAFALYSLGFRLAHDAVTRPPQPDPTARLLEVVSIVNALTSGRFPKCEWVDKAPQLIVEFQTFQPEFAPDNVPRVYQAYQDFVLSRLAAGTPPAATLEFMLEYKVSELAGDDRDKLPLIERFIADLVKAGVSSATATGLQAGVYLRILNDNSMERFPITPAQAAEGARKSLEVLARSSTPRVQAQALADLASLDFHLGRYPEARARYLEFTSRYPESDWAWVAALRAAEALEAIGDLAGAAAEYEKAAARFKTRETATALALIAAAEVRDARGQFSAAAANYKAAIALWDNMPDRVMIFTSQAEGAKAVPKPARFNNLAKGDLVARVERLARTTSAEGALLYQGESALDEDRPRDAFDPLERLIKQFPRSREAVDAAKLLRRGRFELALSSDRTRGSEALLRDLQALTRGADDEVARAAKLAEAALLLVGGSMPRAETLTRAALDEWHAKQPAPAAAVAQFDRDAAAIRALLFTPAARKVLGGGWNAFRWPASPPPFALVYRDVVVSTPDGQSSSRPVPFRQDNEQRFIFLAPGDSRNLNLILDRIGGIQKREPSAIMETPNQPIGGSREIAGMWSAFFHVRPGHWGGWELETYPSVTKIEFDREDHALAHVTIGYSGGAVEVVKENGVWVATRIVSTWIT